MNRLMRTNVETGKDISRHSKTIRCMQSKSFLMGRNVTKRDKFRLKKVFKCLITTGALRVKMDYLQYSTNRLCGSSSKKLRYPS